MSKECRRYANKSKDINNARFEQLQSSSEILTFLSLRVSAYVCLKFNQFEISDYDILNAVDHESNCRLDKAFQI